MAKEPKVSVLFVCMGNICRSPIAEGVFRKLVADAGLNDSIDIDSAGTHGYHIGKMADSRARAAAERRGYTLDAIRARQVAAGDFKRFDYVLAMDRDNLALLREQAPAEYHARISLFLHYASGRDEDVPDPYYGGAAGFDKVLDLVEDASRELLRLLSPPHR